MSYGNIIHAGTAKREQCRKDSSRVDLIVRFVTTNTLSVHRNSHKCSTAQNADLTHDRLKRF